MWSNKMMPNMYNPPPTAGCMKRISIMKDVHVGRLIGKEGKVFNAITERTDGLLYIWYDNKDNTIEIHGENMKGVLDGIRKLNDRMIKLKTCDENANPNRN